MSDQAIPEDREEQLRWAMKTIMRERERGWADVLDVGMEDDEEKERVQHHLHTDVLYRKAKAILATLPEEIPE